MRSLQPAIGSTITQVEVLDDRLGLVGHDLVDAQIQAIERRGKYIVMTLEDRGDLVIHLRMSGRLRFVRSEREIQYTRLTLHLNTGEIIYFVNPRRLGTATHFPGGFEIQLGHEPLGAAFTAGVFGKMTSHSRTPIKTFLLDQKRIAGIGNIYASEALWRAGIAPTRHAMSLSENEVARLHGDIVSVLNEAIMGQGTTIGNSVSDYHPTVDEQGEFQNHLSVYGRESEPCERCGTIIARLKQSGRSTYYCSECQT